MTFRRLVIRPGSGQLGTDTFAWRGRGDESSFHTDLDPELRGFGDVPLAHRDLVTFATGVFLADRTVTRPKSWRRALELEVPVYDVAGWEGLADHFAETLEIPLLRLMATHLHAAARSAGADGRQAPRG